ncbi:hypothetical protein SCOR_29735 [Sulfidibacter corallicola]|uniref:Uncharacterized protein n=1 Tax=Sulfidibacter corallicola TaxID=2818388 RepID=A0A8A4TMC4_SULCO|nr:hypothetical protein [Sulfidibacter corallicola]QTD50262.1 hypothetical protein J3U87_32150 [Sulfidibacter corallicola]
MEFSIIGTIENEMSDTLNLSGFEIFPSDAVWVQKPPESIGGNSKGTFEAKGGGNGVDLAGKIVYNPAGTTIPLTLTFFVDGETNKATATYPMPGPTVNASITPGPNAQATYSYSR